MLLQFIDSLTTHNFTGIGSFKFYGQTSEIGNLSTLLYQYFVNKSVSRFSILSF
jgi:hypothetical protein